MLTGLFRSFKVRAIHIRNCVLAFCWTIGAVFGVLLATHNSDFTGPLALQFAQGSTSLLMLLTCQLIPVLAVWFLDSSGRYLGVYGICFLRMLIFGYGAGAIYSAFSSAGWLVCMFVMFSQVFTSVLLFWLALKVLSGKSRNRRFLYGVAFGSVVIVLLDHFLVSPFFISLV